MYEDPNQRTQDQSASFGVNDSIIQGFNGWPLGLAPPEYFMLNMGMNGAFPVNPTGGIMISMPLNVLPNAACFPLNGPSPYNQFMASQLEHQVMNDFFPAELQFSFSPIDWSNFDVYECNLF